jgi:hypothetical protein
MLDPPSALTPPTARTNTAASSSRVTGSFGRKFPNPVRTILLHVKSWQPCLFVQLEGLMQRADQAFCPKISSRVTGSFGRKFPNPSPDRNPAFCAASIYGAANSSGTGSIIGQSFKIGPCFEFFYF